jgi:hypothetical protein
MPKLNDNAIYYDGTILTFRKISTSSKGCLYYFNELPYPLKEDEFELTSLLIVK